MSLWLIVDPPRLINRLHRNDFFSYTRNDYSSPDLPQDNMNGYWNSYGGNWEVDSIGHGTHISGIISALSNNSGVRGAIDNGNIDIHIQKLVDSARGANSIISDENLIESIEVCASVGSKIINLSLSGREYSEDLRNVIDRLTYQNDVIFVAAAGNHGTTTGSDSKAYPAAYKNVIGVGTININNELADFSPSYNGITFVAPGVDILSSVSTTNNRVTSVYFEDDGGYFDFDYYQIDRGLKHPDTLPTQDSCYYALPSADVSELIIKKTLNNSSKLQIDEATRQCRLDGGSLIVISYDYLNTLDRAEYDSYNTWLTYLDYEASMPTLLIPGLNNEEIEFFKEGKVNVSSIKQEYAAITGSSQSAGVVTAGIVKLWSNFPQASPNKILNSIKNSTIELNGSYPANAVGFGAVHFGNAYEYIKNYESKYSEPRCPDYWYENKAYKKLDKATFKGGIYEANYWSKDQRPNTHSYEYGPWKKIGDCDDFPQPSYNLLDDNPDPYYDLTEIEVIEVVYNCNSYSLSCGGGGRFGGFIGFGGGGGGGFGFGGGDNPESDSEKEAKKQKEYEDMKKRSDTTPKQKPGESKENYNKRLSEYYKKVANDYKNWDDKYYKGRHDQKIRDLKNRASKYDKAYQNLKRHREVTNNHQNGKKGKSPYCKSKARGRARIIQTIGCLFDEP